MKDIMLELNAEEKQLLHELCMSFDEGEKMDRAKREWPDKKATRECNAIGMQAGAWRTYRALVKSGKIKGTENN
jgi:hypothetical protein